MSDPTTAEKAPPPPAAAPFFSAVDSARFGLRIGRVQLADASALLAALETSRREQLRLVFIRCPTVQVGLVHALEATGARLMDTLLYFSRSLAKDDLPAELRPNRIRPFRDTDLPGIESVARQSFTSYRGHYHADPALDPKKADEGYVEWALHCCHTRSATQEVLVAEDTAGQPCGFFVVRLNSPIEGEGWLAAVAPAAEGRGIYWSLMVHAMHWCRDRQAKRLIVSTQLTNSATQKNYRRLGLDLTASYYTFHLWLPAAP